VTTIHSVDSLRLYEEILKRAELIQKKIRVYFQVNIDDEASKGGFKTNELSELSVFVKTHSSEWVKPIGFMCIPDPNQDSTQAFQKMKKISEQFSATLGNQLSMGMSDDFEKAIAAGATSVRIGSALFGARE
jgi:pyridoxal phosphate enzyme (YggS family)